LKQPFISKRKQITSYKKNENLTWSIIFKKI
jgi:hypothetical protein